MCDSLVHKITALYILVFPPQVIVQTANLNYSLGNLEKFFHDIHYPDAINISRQVPPIWINDPPNVPLYCLYGTGVPTPEKFVYGADEFPDTFPKTLFGDGDGTVNIRSLKACQSFVGKQKQKVVTKSFSMHGRTQVGFNMHHERLEPKNGEMIIFPSWLLHGSDNVQNETKDRPVISLNAGYKS